MIHDAVQDHALLRPDAVAVLSGTERVTYSQLDSQANAYATELVEYGVAPGQVVALRMRKSPAWVAAALAVLKCGGAYAALDPRWPHARLNEVVELLASPVVVTDEPEFVSRVPTFQPERIAPTAIRSDQQVHVAVDPATTATALFSSGTTGTPKIVLTPHRAATRLFKPGTPLAFGPGTVMPQTAAPPWDVLILELWGMLTTGGTCILPQEPFLLPSGLSLMVREQAATTVWLTSSLFNMFVEEDLSCFDGLQQVLTGGERLSSRHIQAFLERHPGIAIYNGYGPVEACIFATMHRIEPADCKLADGVPIGRHVDGTQVLVLDDDGRDCPPGQVGELLLSGDGLALGYLGDAEVTAERFPTLQRNGASVRTYRTGDRGYADEDGLLHFKGRTDRQVKVRGVRVEPAALEFEAARLPGVGQCAAVPVPGRLSGFDRLVLFYTEDGTTETPSPRQVRQLLRGRLPVHLLPDTARQIDRLPLTNNGKVDAVALQSLLHAEG